MRDLALIAFIGVFLLLGLKRPFLFVLAYAYVDIVSPQHLAYYLLSGIPISMIVAGLAMAGWLIADSKRDFTIVPRQMLMLALLGYAYFTTVNADLPIDAEGKWEWVWKVLFWSIFLPFTLRTKLRIESCLLIMILSASAIIIVGGLKTLVSGGGYGALRLLVDSNSGLYEGSTISTVAIAIIPIIIWIARFGTVFPTDWRVTLFAAGLIFACLLIPIGTEARTGLICIAVLGILMLRDVKRRIVYMLLVGLAVAIAIPFLPQSYSSRMGTIQTYQADESATTRLAVWTWTWEYARDNPLGGGFEAYRQNSLRVQKVGGVDLGAVQLVDVQVLEDRGRAYHSSYFEMLGEQGFPGLILWLLIQGGGLLRMEVLRRRYRRSDGDEAWIAPLATALQSAQIIYLVGSVFVGIAFQPFMFMLISVQIGFDTFVGRRSTAGKRVPFSKPHPQPRPVPGAAEA